MSYEWVSNAPLARLGRAEKDGAAGALPVRRGAGYYGQFTENLDRTSTGDGGGELHHARSDHPPLQSRTRC